MNEKLEEYAGMITARGYLTLSSAYCKSLGGLRWSPADDSIEYADGSTFALNEEIALFLEGFANIRPLPQFCYVLHFLKLLRGKEPVMPAPIARLRGAFVEVGRPTRNAGVFFAILSHDMPEGLPYPAPATAVEICSRLRDHAQLIRWHYDLYKETFISTVLPSWTPDAFEAHFVRVLASYSREELLEWLRHGRGPVKEAARKLEREIVPPEPQTTTAIMERLLSRSRLAGARLYVDHFVSALTLPARRLDREKIAVGGYDDVVTHGQPDQILPSQFALDDRDFLRRYAEHELLYFRREIPHAKSRQELVVVLDQSVRTWGDVRLVLTGAVIALAKHAERRGFPFRLAATSSEEGLVDPKEADLEKLGEMLEASDLSPNPALTLEHVLGRVANCKADVVLLTHPRNLREEDVRTAARLAGNDVRLFATTLDASGGCTLYELKHGHPVKLRQFHVDIQDPEIEARKAEHDPYQLWHGDVERIGYPFRRPSCPIKPKFLAFDDTSRWLLAVSAEGMLWAWDLEAGTGEMLPRGVLHDRFFVTVEAVIGVADGFVVCGRWSGKGSFCVAHYRCSERNVQVHSLGNSAENDWEWRYERGAHTVAASLRKTGQTFTLHLATGSCYSTIEVASFEPAHVWSIPLSSDGSGVAVGITLDGNVMVARWSNTFTPLIDGRPVLRSCKLLNARLCGLTLALKVSGDQPEGRFVLRLYRGPAGTELGAFPAGQHDPFSLSHDGRFLCRLGAENRLFIHDLNNSTNEVVPIIDSAGHETNVALAGMYVFVSSAMEPRHSHTLCCEPTGLELQTLSGDLKAVMGHALSRHEYPPEIAWEATGCYGSELVRHNADRFLGVCKQHLIAIRDQFGQVAILDRSENLVAMLFVEKDQIALWMPDGTVYGPSSMTGRPSTANALKRIGSALWDATTRTLVHR